MLFYSLCWGRTKIYLHQTTRILFHHVVTCDWIILQHHSLAHINVIIIHVLFFSFLFLHSSPFFFLIPLSTLSPFVPSRISFLLHFWLHIVIESYSAWFILSIWHQFPSCFHPLFSFPFLFMMFPYTSFHSLVFLVIFLFYSIAMQ